MIRWIFILFIFAKTVPYYLSKIFDLSFESIRLYWIVYSVILFMLVLLNYKREGKSVPNLLITSVLFGTLIIDILNFSYQIYDMKFSLSHSWKFRGYFSVSILFYLFIARNRYIWRNLKSDEYNPSKVQAIYSKPNSIITILGATASLSPKCSVRYTYLDKTIRFKRGVKAPMICNTSIKETEIIEDTGFSGVYFMERWEEIKGKEFNLFTFNCRSLFNKKLK